MGDIIDRDLAAAQRLLTKAFALVFPAAGADLGLCCYLEGKFKQAAIWFYRAALLEVPGGMKEYAIALLHGKGVSQNIRAAVDWFYKAALAGEPDAMRLYSVYLLHRSGDKKAVEEGLMWYHRAIKAGCSLANFELASMYLEGRLVPFDVGRAKTLLIGAAETGDVESMYKLACCYLDYAGHENPSEATKWLSAAASHSHSKASWRLGWCCLAGSGTRRDVCHGTALIWSSFSADTPKTTEPVLVMAKL